MKKGFKAFNKGLKCRDFQFEEGKEYETDKVKLCESGFHYCENPLDTLDFYDLCDSEFAEVEDTGNKSETDGKKNVTNKIKIGIKLDFKSFIKASFDFLWGKCSSEEKASGDYSKLAASGDSSQLAASGDYSKVEVTGKDSIACAIGKNSKAKGIKGSWITLSSFNDDGSVNCVKSAKIDGQRLKADTWYKLEDKKFVVCE